MGADRLFSSNYYRNRDERWTNPFMMLASPVVLNHWDVLSLRAAPPLRQLLSRPYQTFKNSQSWAWARLQREEREEDLPR